MLVSGVLQSDSVTYVCFFQVLFHLGYDEVLSIVPCATQYVLLFISYIFIYISVYFIYIHIYIFHIWYVYLLILKS